MLPSPALKFPPGVLGGHTVGKGGHVVVAGTVGKFVGNVGVIVVIGKTVVVTGNGGTVIVTTFGFIVVLVTMFGFVVVGNVVIIVDKVV